MLFIEDIKINKAVVLTAEVIYSSRKIALKTARDGEKNIACVALGSNGRSKEHTPFFFCAHYFQAPAQQAKKT